LSIPVLLLGGKFVAPSRQDPGRGVIPGVHTGGTDRGDRDVDARLIKELQRAPARPRRRRDAADRVVALVGGLPEKVRQHVVVDVNGEGHRSLRASVVTGSGGVAEARSALIWAVVFTPARLAPGQVNGHHRIPVIHHLR
jgi:hypothetical protein